MTSSGLRKPRSLRQRLAVMLVLVPAAVLGAGFVIRVAFAAYQHEMNLSHLHSQADSILALTETSEGSFRFPELLPSPDFNRPGGAWMAVARDGEGKKLWQSLSALGQVLPPVPDSAPAAGEGEYLPEYGEGRWVLFRTSVLYLEDSLDLDSDIELDALVRRDPAATSPRPSMLPLTLEIWQAVATLADPAERFDRVLWAGLSLLGLLLCTAMVLLFIWVIAPLEQMARSLRSLREGRSSRLNLKLPAELEALAQTLDEVLQRAAARHAEVRRQLDGLAHGLKTPIAVLGGLQTGLSGDARKTLTERLDDMEKLVSFHLRRVAGDAAFWQEARPLLPVLQRLKETFLQIYGGRKLEFNIELPALCRLRLSEQDLFELFGNLLDNACKYGGGRIWIRARPEPGYKGAASRVAVTVEDNGDGVPAAERDRILQRGERLDQRQPGHGLGLTLAADLIASYGGRLFIDSSSQGGACFRLLLPGECEGSGGAESAG